LIFHYDQQPADSLIRNIEAFMAHVRAALDKRSEYVP
jgi:hypothetical protein